MSRTNPDEILAHLDKYGIRDKDAIASPAASVLRKKTSSQVSNNRGVMRRRLDLHGKTVENGLVALRAAIDECETKGIRELLVIHGYGRHSMPRGEGVLKKAVLDFLEYSGGARIKDYSQAMIKDGGEGATLVRFVK